MALDDVVEARVRGAQGLLVPHLVLQPRVHQLEEARAHRAPQQLAQSYRQHHEHVLETFADHRPLVRQEEARRQDGRHRQTITRRDAPYVPVERGRRDQHKHAENTFEGYIADGTPLDEHAEPRHASELKDKEHPCVQSDALLVTL